VSQQPMLTKPAILLLCVVVTVATGATGCLLLFVLHASPAFVMIVSCLSIPAMTLLFYMGYMLRYEPKVTSYLGALKVLALLSMAMGVAIVLDFVLGVKHTAMTVDAKVPSGETSILHMGGYEQPVDAERFRFVQEGDVLAVRRTAIFRRIEDVSLAGNSEPAFRRSREDKGVMIAAAVLFSLTIGTLMFAPREGYPGRNMCGFFLLVAPSYILSLVATGLWIKLLLVHAFRVIDKV